MQSLSSIRSQLKKLQRIADADLRIDVLAEKLWMGISDREDVIALELDPNRKTGRSIEEAPTLALKLLDTLTFPELVRTKLSLPKEHCYCWETSWWTVTELLDFFSWFDTPDPDLYDLDDILAERYREQLRAASVAWIGDRIVTRWFLDRIETGSNPEDSLVLLRDPDNKDIVIGELELISEKIKTNQKGLPDRE